MPLGPVFEALLQPVAEAALQIAGYVTARALVPVLTLGRVEVEDFDAPPVKPNIGRIRRTTGGRLRMDAELAALLGLVFWAAVGVCIYLLVRSK